VNISLPKHNDPIARFAMIVLILVVAVFAVVVPPLSATRAEAPRAAGQDLVLQPRIQLEATPRLATPLTTPPAADRQNVASFPTAQRIDLQATAAAEQAAADQAAADRAAAEQAARIADLERQLAALGPLLRIAYAAWSLSDEIDEFGAPVSSETINELDVALLEQFGGPDRDWLVVRGNIRAALDGQVQR
jgi:hypothetical protein